MTGGLDRGQLPRPGAASEPDTAEEGLARWVTAAPEAVVLESTQRRWTYRELAEAVELLAGQLQDAGLRPGTVAGVLVPGDANAVALMLALLRCRIVFTWLHPATPAARQLAVLRDCAAGFLIVGAELLAGAELVRAATAAPARGSAAGLVVLAGLEVTAVSRARPAASALPAEAACVLYTSGSQGRPKGIVQSERSIVRFASWFGGEFGLRPGARLLRWASFAYDAVFAEVLAAPLAGGTVVIPRYQREDPAATLAMLRQHEVTHLQCVPSFARQLLTLLRIQAQPPARLRTLLLAGEVLPPDLAAMVFGLLPGTELVNLYGPTETILACWHRVRPADARAATIPVGQAIPGRRVSVIGPGGQRCPPGEVGEIVVEGDQLSLGYLHDPGDGRFRRGPGGRCTFRTGDRGLLRPDGRLEFCGRLDSQVKVHGNRVELAEVEAALLADPGVAAAIVAARAQDGDTVLSAQVVAPGSTVAELRRRLARQLPSYLVPREIQLVGDLPRLVSGKVDRDAISQVPRPAGPPSPDPGLSAALAAAWTSVLGCGPVGPEDDFFALGGDSLSAARVIVRLAESVGRELPLEAFLDAPAFGDMLAYLAGQPAAGQ
jgi:amino acid adenylation domain-containing protein